VIDEVSRDGSKPGTWPSERSGVEANGTPVLGSDLAHDAAGIAGREHSFRNVPRHHTARPNHRSRPDTDARADDRATTNPYLLADLYPPAEGVSELLICYPSWILAQNRTTREIANNDDYPSSALSLLSRYGYCATWYHTRREAAVSVPGMSGSWA